MGAHPMIRNDPSRDEAQITALAALAWTLADDRRAERLLSLTGLSPEILRANAGEPMTLVALLSFLEGHEPDLVACAAALGLDPARLVRMRELLEGGVA